MKPQHALPAFEIHRSRAQSCILGHLRSLLASIQARHRHARSAEWVDLRDETTHADPAKPSLHDFHAGELDAAMGVFDAPIALAEPVELGHDDPQELSRARCMFVASWLLPFLLVSGVRGLFGGSLDRATTSLLQFSLLGLAIPLAGSLLALVSRILVRSPGSTQQ